MGYFDEAPKPKILLINFSEKQAEIFRQSGYVVDTAFIGGLRLASPDPLRYRTTFYHIPHPPYEYDIFISQTDMPKDGEKYQVEGENQLLCNPDLVSLAEKVKTLHSTSICFVGDSVSYGSLLIAGLPQIPVKNADSRDSTLEIVEPRTFAIEELHQLIENYKNWVVKVHKYFAGDFENLNRTLDIYRIPVFVNNAHRVVCEYGSNYYGGGIGRIPKYILLPEFQDNVKVALGILSKLSNLRPDLFSKSGVESWINLPEFTFDEVKAISEEIAKKEKELTEHKLKKEKEADEINNEFSYMKQILVADDEHFEGDNRLTNCVAKVLSFLGFEVEIREEVAVEGKKREDLYISDNSGFEALCEVKGTTRQNPPEAFYSQLLKHLRKAKDSSLRGLLVVNYDYKTHPFKRNKIYKDAEDLFSDDSDDIGVISTVDLHKIVMDVKRRLLSKEEARNYLERGNRIEYPQKKKSKQ